MQDARRGTDSPFQPLFGHSDSGVFARRFGVLDPFESLEAELECDVQLAGNRSLDCHVLEHVKSRHFKLYNCESYFKSMFHIHVRAVQYLQFTKYLRLINCSRRF